MANGAPHKLIKNTSHKYLITWDIAIFYWNEIAISDEEDSEPIDDEEREWKELQKSVKKEKESNNASTKSHPVHSPFFPAVSNNHSWLY